MCILIVSGTSSKYDILVLSYSRDSDSHEHAVKT